MRGHQDNQQQPVKGEGNTVNIETGKTYTIEHTHRGKFIARVDSVDSGWMYCTIIGGQAKDMQTDEICKPGKVISLLGLNVVSAAAVEQASA